MHVMVVMFLICKREGGIQITRQIVKGCKGRTRRTVGMAGSLTLLAFWVLAAACSQPKEPVPKPYVIRTGEMVISSDAFSDELDLKIIAYPFELKHDPQAYNAMVLDLVAVLSDELVLMAEAAERDIDISPAELDAAEQKFKEDYPEESFEQMLLENAISYPVWKNRLKKDMVISKLLEQELIGAQEITSEDVIAFYDRYARTGNQGNPKDLDEAGLVAQLRMEKSQASYETWMAGLKAKFPVEMNKKAIAAFLLDTSIVEGK